MTKAKFSVSNRPPRWDLSQLYPGIDSAEFDTDLSSLEEMIVTFAKKYKGKITKLTAEDMAAAIATYEKIDSLADRLKGYVALLENENVNMTMKTQRRRSRICDLEEEKSFLVTELHNIEEKEMLAKMSSPALARYASWIARTRDDYDRKMPVTVRSLRDSYDTRNSEAVQRVYNDVMADFRVKTPEGDKTFSEAESAIADWSLPLQARKKMRQDFAVALKQYASRLSFVFNTSALDRNIDTRYAGFDRVESEHVSAARFDPAITAQMVKSMRKLYARTSHRFFSWLAKSQGKEKIHIADLHKAPQDIRDKDPTISFARASDTVFRAASGFSPKMGKLVQAIFEEKRIDASSSAKKNSAPFARQMGASSGSFVSVTFSGVTSPMGTLAHELGHGVHMDMMHKQGLQLESEVSNHISEIPSIFMELLTSNTFLEDEKNPLRKKKFMFDTVQDMIDTGMQQLSYFDFEIRMHKERKSGPLSFEKISDIWMETQREYYGPAVVMDDHQRYYWTAIEHFVTMPFYVSTYPFALAAAGNLLQQHQDAQSVSKEAATAVAERYLEFLKTGAARSTHDTFRMLGIDPYSPEFWEKGASFIEGYIDRLEKMDDKVPSRTSQRRPGK